MYVYFGSYRCRSCVSRWGSSFSNKARRDQYKARKFRRLKDADRLPPSVLEAYERAKNTPNPRSSVTAIINSALERTESKHGARVMLDNQRYQEARVRPPTYLSSESESYVTCPQGFLNT